MRLAAAALAALALAVPAAAAPVPQAPAVPALAFADELHGWLGTAGGILGTADGAP